MWGSLRLGQRPLWAPAADAPVARGSRAPFGAELMPSLSSYPHLPSPSEVTSLLPDFLSGDWCGFQGWVECVVICVLPQVDLTL